MSPSYCKGISGAWGTMGTSEKPGHELLNWNTSSYSKISKLSVNHKYFLVFIHEPLSNRIHIGPPVLCYRYLNKTFCCLECTKKSKLKSNMLKQA